MAGIGAEAADQELEQRRLAGARGAEDRDELARIDVERDAAEDMRIAAGERDVAEAEKAHRRRHGVETRWSRAAMPNSTSVSAEPTSTAARTRSGRKLFLAFRM
jgi:hypothetical protein